MFSPCGRLILKPINLIFTKLVEASKQRKIHRPEGREKNLGNLPPPNYFHPPPLFNHRIKQGRVKVILYPLITGFEKLFVTLVKMHTGEMLPESDSRKQKLGVSKPILPPCAPPSCHKAFSISRHKLKTQHLSNL